MAKKSPKHTEPDFFDSFPDFPNPQDEQVPKKVRIELKTDANKTGRKRDFGDRPSKRVFHKLPLDTIEAFQQAVLKTNLKPNQLLDEMIWEYLENHGLREKD